jgi:hypothetical protein
LTTVGRISQSADISEEVTQVAPARVPPIDIALRAVLRYAVARAARIELVLRPMSVDLDEVDWVECVRLFI